MTIYSLDWALRQPLIFAAIFALLLSHYYTQAVLAILPNIP